jgi:hypothetical protein
LFWFGLVGGSAAGREGDAVTAGNLRASNRHHGVAQPELREGLEKLKKFIVPRDTNCGFDK